jgi:hypothetical protein
MEWDGGPGAYCCGTVALLSFGCPLDESAKFAFLSGVELVEGRVAVCSLKEKHQSPTKVLSRDLLRAVYTELRWWVAQYRRRSCCMYSVGRNTCRSREQCGVMEETRGVEI